MFKKWVQGVWIAEQPQKFLGLEMGTRMTIIDMTGSGDLLLHSPIKINSDIQQALKDLGTVKALIAPNLFHHLYIGDYKKAYPEAQLFGAPGLKKKRPDLEIDKTISDEGSYPWTSMAKHHGVKGTPLCNEIVFFLPKEKILLVTDLGLHICEDSPWLTRLAFRIMGAFKRFGWSRVEKWLFIRNKDSFGHSVETILNWDFDTILLSHGRVVTSAAKPTFAKAFGNSKALF